MPRPRKYSNDQERRAARAKQQQERRKQESAAERSQRLTQDALRHRQTRSLETEAKRSHRLSQDLLRHQNARSAESVALRPGRCQKPSIETEDNYTGYLADSTPQRRRLVGHPRETGKQGDESALLNIVTSGEEVNQLQEDRDHQEWSRLLGQPYNRNDSSSRSLVREGLLVSVLRDCVVMAEQEGVAAESSSTDKPGGGLRNFRLNKEENVKQQVSHLRYFRNEGKKPLECAAAKKPMGCIAAKSSNQEVSDSALRSTSPLLYRRYFHPKSTPTTHSILLPRAIKEAMSLNPLSKPLYVEPPSPERIKQEQEESSSSKGPADGLNTQVVINKMRMALCSDTDSQDDLYLSAQEGAAAESSSTDKPGICLRNFRSNKEETIKQQENGRSTSPLLYKNHANPRSTPTTQSALQITVKEAMSLNPLSKPLFVEPPSPERIKQEQEDFYSSEGPADGLDTQVVINKMRIALSSDTISQDDLYHSAQVEVEEKVEVKKEIDEDLTDDTSTTSSFKNMKRSLSSSDITQDSAVVWVKEEKDNSSTEGPADDTRLSFKNMKRTLSISGVHQDSQDSPVLRVKSVKHEEEEEESGKIKIKNDHDMSSVEFSENPMPSHEDREKYLQIRESVYCV